MSKDKTLMNILTIRRKTSSLYQKFLSTPREYFPGEKLLMREVHVLIKIGFDGIDNVSELANKMGVTNGAVSQYLSKLEKKGFINRIQDTNDKRQFSVVLTEKGKQLYNLHTAEDKQNYKEIEKLFDAFTEEELAVVNKFDKQFEIFMDRLNKEYC